ncbi:MAG TPA: DUF1189 family protein [Candidatus Paceibacterota bacterium]
MKIFKEIRDSIYNPAYYKSVPSEPLRASVKYLAKLSLLVALAALIVFSFFVPKIFRSASDGMDTVTANFPDDLIVSIKNGSASINKPEPYTVPLSNFTSGDKKWEGKNPSYTNVIVIDTTKPFSVEQFESYSSAIWLTKTELVTVKDRGGQIQITPLSRVPDSEITKPWLLDKKDAIVNALPWVIPALAVLGYLILFLVSYIGTLLCVLLYAIFIWLMGKMAKKELSYEDSYKIGIHAATLLVLLGLLTFSPFNFPYNFFVKLVILLAIVYINFFNDSAKTEEVAQ